MRRKDVAAAKPNAAHTGLAELEKFFDVHVITQNIDDLHERGGSTKVLHLHGEIFKMRSEKTHALVKEIRGDIMLGDCAEDGYQYRPNIVWFEEPVPAIEEAVSIVNTADIFVVVGTSLVVYPAAGLINYAAPFIPKFIIDKQVPYTSSIRNLTAIEKPATEGVRTLIEVLRKDL
jgi:NAD-dependent deacetylase